MAEPATAPRATWSWPSFTTATEDAGSSARQRTNMPGHFDEDHGAVPEHTEPPGGHVPPAQTEDRDTGDAPPRPSRSYGPRTCRICLDVVYPTYHMPSEHVPGFLSSRRPRVVYESDDPELGRLLRPCKCKGSSRYVHEGCLEQWRKADPAMGSRNYWQCPTCKFTYRLQRMSFGRWLNSTLAQLALTVLILAAAVFLLGFVADPIINLYLDPYDTMVYGVEKIPLTDDDEVTWIEHFVKGLASLGLLGFVKALLAMSPWHLWNVRSSGIMNTGGRQGTTGRDRVANISWAVLIVGIGTFLYAVFRGVRAWSRRTLEMASERVMDVPLADDEDEDEIPSNAR